MNPLLTTDDEAQVILLQKHLSASWPSKNKSPILGAYEISIHEKVKKLNGV